METLKIGENPQYRYEYDANGNIVREYEGTILRHEFAYDALGQLTAVSNSTVFGAEEGIFTYDANGNLLQKSFDGVTDTYGYTDSAWGDLLTSYNGVAITYDAIGNPLSYYNGEQYVFTWQNGRQLATATFGGKQMSFEYNEAGMRTAKTVGELRTEYVYDGALLLRETQKDADGNVVYTISFTYDEIGRPFSATFAGETYYYVYDVYGNVSVIYTSAGERVIRYTYPDPWGYEIANRVTGTAARAFNNVNPYKYKGYYCDADLDLYYCGSRYYDSYTCRWINADSQLNTSLGILGLNQFSYCLNNSVNMVDYDGNKPGDLFETMDLAARDAAVYMGDASWRNNWEYGTVIYTKTVFVMKRKVVTEEYNFLWWSWTEEYVFYLPTFETRYTYVEPTTSGSNRVVEMPEAPFLREVVAGVHTHPMGSWKGITEFSPEDKYTANRLGVRSCQSG